jgi:hypothetical protein
MDFDKIVDLINNLPYCPFCNTEPVTKTNWDENERPKIMVSCSDEECPAGQIWVPVEKWSTRPLEDALQKKLDIAIDLLDELSHWDMLWLGEGEPSLVADGPFWKEQINKTLKKLRV